MEARVLPAQLDAAGRRGRSLQSAAEDARQEVIEGMEEPRAATRRLRHLAAEGRSLGSHFEHCRNLCNQRAGGPAGDGG
eukprot:11167858-Alexandrium_andersonii.AAC.1